MLLRADAEVITEEIYWYRSRTSPCDRTRTTPSCGHRLGAGCVKMNDATVELKSCQDGHGKNARSVRRQLWQLGRAVRNLRPARQFVYI